MRSEEGPLKHGAQGRGPSCPGLNIIRCPEAPFLLGFWRQERSAGTTLTPFLLNPLEPSIMFAGRAGPADNCPVVRHGPDAAPGVGAQLFLLQASSLLRRQELLPFPEHLLCAGLSAKPLPAILLLNEGCDFCSHFTDEMTVPSRFYK